jgi:hypothetical protein
VVPVYLSGNIQATRAATANARTITSEYSRAQALAGLAHHLSEPRRIDLVEEFRSVDLATDLLLSLQSQARRATWPRLRFVYWTPHQS